MKKFFIPAAMGLLLASCASDEPGLTNDTDKTGLDGDHYMAINIVANSASRADDPTYADGDADEYLVVDQNAVTFYFFDKDGAAFAVSGSGSDATNIIQGESISDVAVSDHKDGDNITSKKLLVVLKSRTDGTVPSQVVAVLNKPTDAYTDASKLVDLATLKAQVTAKYSSSATVESASHTLFMMTNSIYKDDDGNEVYATPIKPENITTSSDAAAEAPVEIYVERTVAKVSVTNDLTAAIELKETGVDYTDDSTTDLTKVYAKIVGWKLFNTAENTTVLKNITGYAPSTSWSWNSAAEFRSFWAVVDNTLSVGTKTLSYNTMAANHTSAATGLAKNEYAFENTLPTSYTKTENVNGSDTETTVTLDANTGIAFAAVLYSDANCTTKVDVAKWLSSYYTLAQLQKAIAGYLSEQLFTYTAATSDDAQDTWTSITPDDILFKSCADGYKVLPTLALNTAGDAYAKDWYAKGSTTALTKDQIDAILNAVPKAQIWKDGQCYYYAPITHSLNSASAVVRNHWYKVTVNSIKGLGTPIYDPTVVATPTKPEGDDEWFLDARINVLSWRLMNNTLDLTSE
jgi:hypothetical protein